MGIKLLIFRHFLQYKTNYAEQKTVHGSMFDGRRILGNGQIGKLWKPSNIMTQYPYIKID